MKAAIKSENVDEVLASIEALSVMEPKPIGDSAKDVLSSLASYLESAYPNVHIWVCQRRYSPKASTFLEMKNWRDLIVAKFNRSEKIGYRKALAVVKEKHLTKSK
jgi:hypothetical protein